MNNTSIIKSILSVLLMSVSIIFMNCTGKQGDPGPAGANGANATNGKDGKNGTDDPLYVDAMSRGGISVSLTGTRPDGASFQSDLDFDFSPVAKEGSYVYRQRAHTDSTNDFNLARYMAYNAGEWDASNEVHLTLNTTIDQYGDTAVYFYMRIDASVTFPSEHSFFELWDDYEFRSVYNDDGTGPFIDSYNTNVNRPSFVYTYDSASGNLKSTASFKVPANYNATGSELTVKVTTDATVTRSLTDLGFNFNNNQERKSSRSAKQYADVPKAVMKDMK